MSDRYYSISPVFTLEIVGFMESRDVKSVTVLDTGLSAEQLLTIGETCRDVIVRFKGGKVGYVLKAPAEFGTELLERLKGSPSDAGLEGKGKYANE